MKTIANRPTLPPHSSANSLWGRTWWSSCGSRRRSRAGCRWTRRSTRSLSPWPRWPPGRDTVPAGVPGCPAGRPWSVGARWIPDRGRGTCRSGSIRTWRRIFLARLILDYCDPPFVGAMVTSMFGWADLEQFLFITQWYCNGSFIDEKFINQKRVLSLRLFVTIWHHIYSNLAYGRRKYVLIQQF